MRTLLISLLLAISVSGCGFFGREEPLTIMTKPAEKTPLDLPMPEPLKPRPFNWVVVTPENAEEIFRQMEARGQTPVLLALTDDGYQQLAISMADIRNLIAQQRLMIIKYKEYYEPKKTEKK